MGVWSKYFSRKERMREKFLNDVQTRIDNANDIKNMVNNSENYRFNIINTEQKNILFGNLDEIINGLENLREQIKNAESRKALKQITNGKFKEIDEDIKAKSQVLMPNTDQLDEYSQGGQNTEGVNINNAPEGQTENNNTELANTSQTVEGNAPEGQTENNNTELANTSQTVEGNAPEGQTENNNTELVNTGQTVESNAQDQEEWNPQDELARDDWYFRVDNFLDKEALETRIKYYNKLYEEACENDKKTEQYLKPVIKQNRNLLEKLSKIENENNKKLKQFTREFQKINGDNRGKKEHVAIIRDNTFLKVKLKRLGIEVNPLQANSPKAFNHINQYASQNDLMRGVYINHMDNHMDNHVQIQTNPQQMHQASTSNQTL